MHACLLLSSVHACCKAASQSRMWCGSLSPAGRNAGWELTGSHAWDASARRRSADHSRMPDEHVALIDQHASIRMYKVCSALTPHIICSLQLMGIGSCEGGVGGAASRFCSW